MGGLGLVKFMGMEMQWRCRARKRALGAPGASGAAGTTGHLGRGRGMGFSWGKGGTSISWSNPGARVLPRKVTVHTLAACRAGLSIFLVTTQASTQPSTYQASPSRCHTVGSEFDGTDQRASRPVPLHRSS